MNSADVFGLLTTGLGLASIVPGWLLPIAPALTRSCRCIGLTSTDTSSEGNGQAQPGDGRYGRRLSRDASCRAQATSIL